MTRNFALAPITFALTLAAALPAFAGDDMIRVKSAHNVPATAGRLASAIGEAGATVFARVDHGAGARRVGQDIGESVAVIFGNPEVGTPAMVANPLAGALLPLQVLVYQDKDGQVWLAHENIVDRLGDLDGIDGNDPAIQKLGAAVDKLVATAAAE